MKRIILIIAVFLCTISYGQKKNVTKSIDLQVIEYLHKFERLDKSQQRIEANKLVAFLNNTDSKTKGLWLEALEKHDTTSKKNKVATNQDTEIKSNSIIVSTFSNIPSEFEGCSFLFSQNKAALGKKQFLYFDDMGTNAIIAINGVTLKLKKSSSFIEGEDEIVVYSNDEFSAYIHLKKYLGDSSEESQAYSAELVIKDNKGNELSTKVYGEGGC